MSFFESQTNLARRPLFWFALSLYALATWGLTRIIDDRLHQTEKEKILGYAPSYAWVFERLGHDKISKTTSANDLLYLELIAYQKGWLNSNQFIADIYTMRRDSDGSIFLVVDSETDYDGSGSYDQEREMRTKIGETYTNDIRELKNAFNGQASFTAEPYKDRWGEWYSAFVPLRDQNGKIDAVLGVDFPLKKYTAQAGHYRLLVILCSLLLLISIFVMYSSHLRQKKQNKRLAEALDSAQEATKVKAEFIANMSHEIRTPLNGIMGIAQLLTNSTVNEEQKRHLQLLSSCGENLLNLINDILDFSKIESGHSALEVAPFQVLQTVRDTVEIFRARAKEKNLDLVFNSPLRYEETVKGDVTKFRQVLFNLINNAIKFTPKGKIEVFAETQMISADKVQLHAYVKDTGLGIAKENLSQLFKVFSQINNSATRKHGGTGLGLSICRSLCELMGGKIWVESELGLGSTFHFTAILQPAETQITNALSSPLLKLNAQTTNLRFLVADDNRVNQIVALGLLQKIGCQADAVANGLEALDALTQNYYDVIFMDCQMPEMDGFEATLKIHQRYPPEKRPYIVALTASAFAQDRDQCFAAGMNDFIAKPFTTQDLVKVLFRIQESKFAQSTSKFTDIFEKSRRQFEGDEDILLSALSLYLDEYPHIISKLSQAIEDKNNTDIRRIAHKLRGSIAHFAPPDLLAKILNLEKLAQSNYNDKLSELFNEINESIKLLNSEVKLQFFKKAD